MHIIPVLGFGQLGRTLGNGGYQLTGGLQLEGDLGWALRPVASAGVWTIPMVCAPAPDHPAPNERCSKRGWSGDVGFNVGPGGTSRVLPYAGAGFGVYSAYVRARAANVRVGMDGGRFQRVGYRVEGRYTRMFDAYNRHVLQLAIGVAIRIGSTVPE